MGCCSSICSCCPCCGGETKYEVSLAGAGCVNGTYIHNGTYNNCGVWKNEENTIQLWFNGGEWRFGRTNDYYYTNPDYNDGTPPIMGWEIPDTYKNENADRPVPNITPKLF